MNTTIVRQFRWSRSALTAMVMALMLMLQGSAHARGFVGKENRRFDFHGYPAVEAVYPAGSRGPIHGLMIQLGRANFRVTVLKPKFPDAASNIAELFRRHALERGLMKEKLQGGTP